LKIAIITDTFSIEQGTGIARYKDELIRGLAEACEIEVIGSGARGTPKSLINHVVVTPAKVLWNKNDFDVFHALAPVNGLSLPLLSKPTIVTYHDLATLLYRKGSSWHLRFSAPHFYKLGKYCNKVIANSSQTKNELVQHLNFPQEKICVINLGVAERFQPAEKTDMSHFSIGFIGALAARKRVDYLLRAFYYLKKEHGPLNVKLKIYGRRDTAYQSLVELADDLNIRKDVEFHGPVPEKDLVGVYNSLDAYVVPSEWEGFGLPILEAQRCGIPVVIRADAHIPEEVGRHCLKATSARHMADILYEILEDDAVREHIARTGLEYSKRFTWEKTVKETISIYKEVLSGDLS
jgi:glycosyltransferase involved in cell wall biosynthesis